MQGPDKAEAGEVAGGHKHGHRRRHGSPGRQRTGQTKSDVGRDEAVTAYDLVHGLVRGGHTIAPIVGRYERPGRVAGRGPVRPRSFVPKWAA